MLTESALGDGLPPLAEAKLAAPRQRTGIVRRPRIVRTLDEGAESSLTLVSAPAGYGKTTAVRDWCTSSPAALAWVTLDAGDNEPARLWTYIATAVDRIREGLGRRALKRLRAARVPIETPIDELMNGIAEFGRDLAIVLDDLQFVTAQECLGSLEYAIRRLPATARLIVITRADPALGLARLRPGAALAELRASELSFTTDEVRELLIDRAELELDEGEIEILGQRTEGWPAALYLAALWLRSIDDPHRAVREFGGNQRYVAQYLSQELIEGRPPTPSLRSCTSWRATGRHDRSPKRCSSRPIRSNHTRGCSIASLESDRAPTRWRADALGLLNGQLPPDDARRPTPDSPGRVHYRPLVGEAPDREDLQPDRT